MTTRPLLLIATVCVALAGCVDTPAPVENDVPAAATRSGDAANDAAAFAAEGVVWLTVTTTLEGSSSTVDFPVNASGMSLGVILRKGRWVGSEAPTSLASVMAEVVDPDGNTVAEAMMPFGADTQETTLAADALTAGPHTLRLTTWGGSDGAGHGHYVAFRILAGFASTAS